MSEVVNIAWAVIFCIVGAVVGIVMILVASIVFPRLLAKVTPRIDEEKEILRGNQAVAQYFGRVVSAAIIGVSIVVGAAVLGGILAGLM